MRNVTIENAINQKLKKKKRESFPHDYTLYLRWTNNNHAVDNIDKKQGAGFFFPTMEKYLTVTNISKTVSLEGEWTYLNEKYLRDNNFPRLLI